jgi:hypothetical protein
MVAEELPFLALDSRQLDKTRYRKVLPLENRTLSVSLIFQHENVHARD